MNSDHIMLDGIMGLVVGDALGVPVEFKPREELKRNPVTKMIGYGTYPFPPGTWSDDSSMALATLKSLRHGVDYQHIMQQFLVWRREENYTPYGEVFDIGGTTDRAISRFASGTSPLECGGRSPEENGNGSLMRILPMIIYLCKENGLHCFEVKENIEVIHNTSCLTHAHIRSQIACGIYARVIASILEYRQDDSPLEILEKSIIEIFDFYNQAPFMEEIAEETSKEAWRQLNKELWYYRRLQNIEIFSKLPEDQIKSSGYVVDTLEAAIWCFLTTHSYAECVLKAVNLGSDTDTVAAVAGGMAGCFYGYDAIPKDWLSKIAKREWIEGLCRRQDKIT